MKNTKTTKQHQKTKNKTTEEAVANKFPLPLLTYKTFKDVQEAVRKKEVAFGVRPQALMKLAKYDVMDFRTTFFCNFLLGFGMLLFIPFSIIMGICTGVSWWYFASIFAFFGNFLSSPYCYNYSKDFPVIGTVVFVLATCMGWNQVAIFAFIFALFGIMSNIGRIICQVKIEKIVLENEQLFITLWNDSQIYLLHHDKNQTIENLRITSFLVQAYMDKKAYEEKDEESKKDIKAIAQSEAAKIQYDVEYKQYRRTIFAPEYTQRIQFFFLTLFIVLLCKSLYIWAVIAFVIDLIIYHKDKKAKAQNLYYGKNS